MVHGIRKFVERGPFSPRHLGLWRSEAALRIVVQLVGEQVHKIGEHQPSDPVSARVLRAQIGRVCAKQDLFAHSPWHTGEGSPSRVCEWRSWSLPGISRMPERATRRESTSRARCPTSAFTFCIAVSRRAISYRPKLLMPKRCCNSASEYFSFRYASKLARQ